MRCVRTLLSIVVALLLLGLTGCGEAFDAAGLVRNNLDLNYRNQYTREYLDSVELTVAEANQIYEESISAAVSCFCTYFDIDLTQCSSSVESRLAALFRQLYPSGSYEVGEAKASGKNFRVAVTVYPIDVMESVAVQARTFANELSVRSDAGEFYGYTSAELEELWAQGLIALLEAQVTDFGYLEGEIITVHVNKTDGVYAVDADDLTKLNSMIIAYP